MKRSHAVALGATGLIVAGLWVGRAGNSRVDSSPMPEGDAQAQIYASVSECITGRAPLMPERDANGSVKLAPEQQACEREFTQATANHIATAPKFAAQNECETQYGAGQCRPASHNGASVFVPAMLGFMVANHLFQGQRNAQALLPPRQAGIAPCPPGITPAQQPGCLMRREPGSSSSSSSSSSSNWRSWSTSSGHSVSRNGTERASTIPAGAASAPAARTSLGAAPTRSAASTSASRSSSSLGSSSSSSVSRGGFGSTGHSASSSS